MKLAQAKFDREAKLANATSEAKFAPGDVEVFEHADFNTKDGDQGGWRFRTGLDVVFMEDYNDEASSIIIYSGTWTFYEHHGYNQGGNQPGWAITLGPGYYSFVGHHGMGNDQLSSFRQVG